MRRSIVALAICALLGGSVACSGSIETGSDVDGKPSAPRDSSGRAPGDDGKAGRAGDDPGGPGADQAGAGSDPDAPFIASDSVARRLSRAEIDNGTTKSYVMAFVFSQPVKTQ